MYKSCEGCVDEYDEFAENCRTCYRLEDCSSVSYDDDLTDNYEEAQ